MKKHLYSTMTATDEGERAARIESVLGWIRGIREDFSRDADAEGMPLRVWEAWAMRQATPPCSLRHELHHRLEKAGLMPTQPTMVNVEWQEEEHA